MELLNQLIAQLPGLVGFAALFTAAINIAKIPGWVTPENEPNVQAILSFGLLGVLLAGQFFGFSVAGFDVKAAYLASVVGAIVQFLVQFGLLKATHAVVRGVGYMGASYRFAAAHPTVKLFGMPNGSKKK